jgi:hypothetical protein
MVSPNKRDESFQRWRERMLAETSRFIEWGLQHPEEVTWIPKHRVGAGRFTERLKNIFWTLALRDDKGPR